MANFQYALNSSTIMPTPLLEKIQIAGHTGYAGIELWHSDLDAHIREGGSLADVRKALDDNALAVPTTIFLKGWWDTVAEVPTGTYNPWKAAFLVFGQWKKWETHFEEVSKAAMDDIKRRLGQAAEIGAPHSIAGPPLGKVSFEVGARQYGRLLQVGREFGVKPVMEYLGFAEQVNTIGAALRVMDRSGDPDATIVLDPFHCFRGGGGMEEIARLKPEQIAVSHFNDAPTFPPRELQLDPDRVLPGEGVIDLKRYCDLLRQVGYRGWLSLELFNRSLWAQDPREVARTGLEKMRAIAES